MTAILRDPYTSQCCWWAPAELLRRFLFILLINIIPGNLVSKYVCSIQCYTYLLVLYVGITVIINDDSGHTIHIYYAIQEKIY